MAPEVRENLSRAAGDAQLPPWQRDFMLRVARGGEVPGPDLGAAAHASDATNGAWTELIPSGTPPTAREGHCAIYDPVRDRMVVFGGYDGSYRDDVWALALAGAPAWTQLGIGTPPSTRSYYSAIYDPVRDRMVVFGGNHGGTLLNDVWELALAGTPEWTQLTPAGVPPSARQAHSAIYDPVRDRMLVFGGYSDVYPNYLYDVWALSLAGTPAWTKLTPTGVPSSGRYGHNAIYDAVRDRMVVFGGGDGSNCCHNDVWVLLLTGTPAWTPMMPTGTPPGERYGQSAIYDPVRDRMLVFAGEAMMPPGPLNDAWALSLATTPTWTQLSPTGSPPSGRFYHSAICDALGDGMVVFGGNTGAARTNDVWTLIWGTATGVGDAENRPLVGCLRPPVPNPFSGTTALSYSVVQRGRVQLGVYDPAGRLMCRLVDGEHRAGTETVVWDGTGEAGTRLRAGVYFVTLTGPGIRAARKVVLVR